MVSPKNQAVIAGDPAQFDCTPQDGDPQLFQWIQGAVEKPISSGQKIFDEFIGRVAVLISGKTYNLYINSTSTNDALQYGCSNPQPFRKQFAQLLVLGRFGFCNIIFHIPMSFILSGLSFEVILPY